MMLTICMGSADIMMKLQSFDTEVSDDGRDRADLTEANFENVPVHRKSARKQQNWKECV
jgi:hypothetical protein